MRALHRLASAAVVAATVSALPGCATLIHLNPGNSMECRDWASVAVVELALAATSAALISYGDEDENYFIGAGVLAADGLIGAGTALVCAETKGDPDEDTRYIPVPQEPVPTMPTGPGQEPAIPDATPEQLGLPRPPPVDLTIDHDVTPPPPSPTEVGTTCQINPRKDCPTGYYCVLTEENTGRCERIR